MASLNIHVILVLIYKTLLLNPDKKINDKIYKW